MEDIINRFNFFKYLKFNNLYVVIATLVSLFFLIFAYVLFIQNINYEALFNILILIIIFGLFLFIFLIIIQLRKTFFDQKSFPTVSKLRWRVLTLFCGISVIPALVTVAFTFFLVEFSLRGWFDKNIYSAIDSSIQVAEGYLDEHKRSVKASILSMANDINREAPKFVGNPSSLNKFISTQAALRKLSEAFIIDSSKIIIGKSQFSFYISLSDINDEMLGNAKGGEFIFLNSDSNNKIRGIIKLNRYVDAYLYAARYVDPIVIEAINKTKLATDKYQTINIQSTDLKISFGFFFLVLFFLLLLISLWIGLNLSNSILIPLTALINVSELAKKGNLNVRVPTNLGIDEISKLSSSFNNMLDVILKNREDMIDANIKLTQRKEFTEAILSGVSSGVIHLDKDGKITHLNVRAREILSFPDIKLIGQKFLKFFPEFNELMNISKTNKNIVNKNQIEIGIKNKVTLISTVKVEIFDNKISGYILTVDDITDLLTAQKKAAWADIAQKLAHEIRNPLTPIQLAVERMKLKFQPNNKKEIYQYNQYLETIQRQVDDIGRLTKEFSLFARMPKANLIFSDLEKIILTQLPLFKGSNNNVVFEFIPNESAKKKILIDPQLFRQALTNLIQNSLDSINEAQIAKKGKILINTYEESNILFLIVEDNGPGFSKDRYSLLNPYVTLRPNGSGLGLSIVKRIVDEHKGKISLEDSMLGGAKIIIELNI